MSTTYVNKVNGMDIYAARAVSSASGTNIDTKFQELDQAIGAIGSYEVVSLTTGANPVPDVANPSTKIIYLTKDAASTVTDPYTEWIYIVSGSTGTWQVIGETSIDLSNYKTKQTAVSVTGGTLKGVASMSQDANGVVTLVLNDIQNGTTAQKGVVQLEDSHTSTSTSKAATPKNVKEAYDLASGKYSKPSGGIPSTDLASDVQVSLGKADTAIQGVKANGTTLSPDSNNVVNIPSAGSSTYGVVTVGTIDL